MKNLKRALAILLTAAMTMGMGLTAMADEQTGNTTGSITITPPAGTHDEAENTYEIYKVFDAVGDGSGEGGKISYRLVEGKTEAPVGFSVDAAGNVTYTGSSENEELTQADIQAIKKYVENDKPVAKVTVTGPNDAVAKNLPNGYYFITTTTGTLVTIDSTNPNVTVEDKNSVPGLNKKITGASSLDEDGKKALAQLGTTVSYMAEVTIGKGAQNYAFHDTMSNSLSYNGDVKVWIGDNEVGSENYSTVPQGDDTLTISFNDEYIKTLEVGTVLEIKYSATITAAALSKDPAKNTAYVSYGDENTSNSTPVSETFTYNAQFTITKKDGEGAPLGGAGFVIAKTVKDESEGAAETATKTQYYKIVNGVVSWVDSIDDATEYKSDTNGAVPAFTGLVNGTYTVIEKTVPAGYNKAADKTFTIEEHDYKESNLEQTAEVVNNAGVVLPHTGGIGTTLFTLIGTILVIGAGVMLVTRRRMEII